MVGLEIMHFCIVQFMFEDKSILHYMNNEQFDSHEKSKEGLGIIENHAINQPIIVTLLLH